MLKELLIGNTVKLTWINSGQTPSVLYANIYSGSETLVDSVAYVSSGNGHYYALHTVADTPGLYVAETLATISGKPYKNRNKFRAVEQEVD